MKENFHIFDFQIQILRTLFFILIFFSFTKINGRFFNSSYYFSEIHLVIQGSGTKNFLYNNDNIYEPSEVIINGYSKTDICKYSCEFDLSINNITLRYENQLETFKKMFLNIQNMIEIDLSGFDTSKVTSMYGMFYNCSKLEKINFGNICTTSLNNMAYLFTNCISLKSINLSNFDTSSVTNMGRMFANCQSLESIYFGEFNTSLCEDMSLLFYCCEKLTSIDFSNFDTSKVTTFESMFDGCLNLENINFGKINTSSLKDMSYLFNDCDKLSSIDISMLDTSKVSTFKYMFSGCKGLISVKFGNINTSSIKTINHLFSDCGNLKKVDLRNFDTSSITDMSCVFYNCTSLKSIIFPDYMNTSKVKSLASMFFECNNLISINLSSADFPMVTEIHYMFYNDCNIKYINMANFSPLNLVSLYSAFKNLNTLIYLNLNSFINTNSTLKEIIQYFNSDKTKYCVNDPDTAKFLFGDKAVSDCTNICFNKNIKLDIETNECIVSCSTHNYELEYNNICYHECPEDTYLTVNNSQICHDKTPEGYYLDLDEKIYKYCFYSCEYCYGEGNEINNNCTKCRKGFINLINGNLEERNCYKICKYYYIINDLNQYECTENPNCPENYNKLITEKNKCINDCKRDNIYKYEYNNFCYIECPKGTIPNNFICLEDKTLESIINPIDIIYKYSSELIFNDNIVNNTYKSELGKLDDFLNYLRRLLLNGYNTTDIDNGIDYIHREGPVTFIITIPKNQKNNTNKNNTSINMGKCENILREEYHLANESNLYILKVEEIINGIKSPKVEYEIYYPISENKLKVADLSLCQKVKFDISIPAIISKNEIDKYNSSSGYYNDICYTLTTESGTDISLEDRRLEFIKYNLSICEEGCQFTQYDFVENKAICSCYTKITLPLISEIKFDKEKLLSNFLDIKNIGNFKILKCTHLLFNKDKIFKKAANYLLVILFILDIISIFHFFFSSIIQIKTSFSKINLENKLNKDKINPIPSTKQKNENRNRYKSLKVKINRDNINKLIKNKNHEPPKLKSVISKRKSKHKRISQPISFSDNYNIHKKSITTINKQPKRKTIKTLKKFENSNSNLEVSNKNISNIKLTKEVNTTQKDFTDYEMNCFNYEEAIKYDHRSYCQYYVSLLKTKHILIFTFCKIKDYNSRLNKLFIFLFTFYINFTVSVMFYSQYTMHKIYIDKGDFDFTYQLPKMFYSLLISTVLKSILNTLGLYGNNIIELRKSKNDVFEKNSKKLLSKIKSKIIFFFIVTNALLFLFWIYLGCFCAVNENTQIHLFLDVISSFVFSFITPFMLYLIPGIFRISSLKDRKQDHHILFKFSKILQKL